METFLAILLALGIYVVIPVLIGLFICSVAILYDRKFHVKEKSAAGEKTSQEKMKDIMKVS